MKFSSCTDINLFLLIFFVGGFVLIGQKNLLVVQDKDSDLLHRIVK